METLLEERPRSGEEVISGDEELLRRGSPVVRVGRFREPVVSVGVSQKGSEPFVDRAAEAGLPVVRRVSGGGPLLHGPGDLFWSLVLPRAHSLAGAGFVRNYARLGAGWTTFLATHGISAGWTSPPASNEGYCLLSSRGEVLASDGRVLGGASQHVTQRALLHHGVVNCALDRDLLSRIFGLQREELALLTSLEELGVPSDLVQLRTVARHLTRALETLKGVEGVPVSPSDDKRVS
ncbi:MAG: lipoate--protein ligase family protein [Euryarchaeota archaeon]|nr:lipoate--protein ligase family protein [Euryarchaeota archaeon]MDE1880116.1 lipoate--protein ligase family protein [Euryarchaeota archaeon]MDE2045046.1 lipoate--protein ligase family protein [Thermoplasmata archaeon]